MTAEQRRESLQREKYYKKMLRKHFLPFLLPALSPFYDPAEKRPPRGLKPSWPAWRSNTVPHIEETLIHRDTSAAGRAETALRHAPCPRVV